MSNQKKKVGLCKLTKKKGTFVKSHLIPQALTRPEEKGSPFLQIDRFNAIRRWSSWYDSSLVIQKGEDILTRLDTWGIEELRKQKLVWSGWGKEKKLWSQCKPIGGEEHQIFARLIKNTDTKKLRLFLLSLLWRAAATNLPEFSHVSLKKSNLEKLRLMLINDNPYPLKFYPITLTQLSTIGDIHNHAPVYRTKELRSIDQQTIEEYISFYRFYFDGLIIHFNINSFSSEKQAKEKYGQQMVGYADEITISTIDYEISYQKENLIDLIPDSIFQVTQLK